MGPYEHKNTFSLWQPLAGKWLQNGKKKGQTIGKGTWDMLVMEKGAGAKMRYVGKRASKRI